eukprot:3827063-Amphidinium_carterae.1
MPLICRRSHPCKCDLSIPYNAIVLQQHALRVFSHTSADFTNKLENTAPTDQSFQPVSVPHFSTETLGFSSRLL